MEGFFAVVAAVGALSLTVTKVVDFFRNATDKDDSLPKWVWNVLSLVVGLAFALGWELNIAGALVALIPALAEKSSMVEGIPGEILTGAVIGLSAGFWHELLDSLSSIANRNNATVPPAEG